MMAAARNAQLHVRPFGADSAPILLVLCNLGTEPMVRQVPAALGGTHRLVFVDLRGCGESTGEVTDLDFDLLAEDLEAVRRALGAERVAVLGHSIVSVLAIEYARRRPHSVSHVIAAGAPPHTDMTRMAADAQAFFERDASAERQQALRQNLAALPPGADMGLVLAAQTPMRFFDARTDLAPLYQGAILKPAMLGHLLGAMTTGWNVGAAGASLRVPLLLAHGRYDYVVPHELWPPLLPRLASARLELFWRSGHQPFCEEPERFTEVVAGFTAGGGGARCRSLSGLRTT
jgi:proline iminopeptidase